MGNSKQNLGLSLDTLAVSRTAPKDHEPQNNICQLIGEGSTKASIRKRPKKKYITQKICLALISVAEKNGETAWVKRYWNTWHCQNKLTTYEGKSYGYFCKNRWCLICVAIRKADMINRYKPVISKWSDPQFLTLTVKAQPNQNLQNWMDGMLKAFSLILDRCRKRHQRGKGPKLIGIRSLESNYNPKKNWYNPHYHIMTASKEISDAIKKEWLQIWNQGEKSLALPYLQKNRNVKHTEKDLVETIKYGSKIFTDPTMNKSKDKNVEHFIYAAALHEIYKVMNDRKLFSSFGFKLPKSTKDVNRKEVCQGVKQWLYDPNIKDWIDEDTGQIMTNYIPDMDLEDLLNERVDLDAI